MATTKKTKTAVKKTPVKTAKKATTATKKTTTVAKKTTAKAAVKPATKVESKPTSVAKKAVANKKAPAKNLPQTAATKKAAVRKSAVARKKSMIKAINPIYNPIAMLQEFLKLEAAAGAILIMCAGLAMIVANSPLAYDYHHILHETKAVVSIGNFGIEKDIIHWINDGLMAIFFFLVGLEIKPEIMEGMLSTRERLILPIIAAIGGMVVPGLVFYLVNMNSADPYALNGWAVPTATDIAFALGVLSVLGKRVPIAMKVFLLALAIIDDLGAIVIIALFYTAKLDIYNLMVGGAFILGLITLNKMKVSKGSLYMLLGVGLWICVLKSGIHATLAGVVTAFAIPLQIRGERRSLLRQLEHDLHAFIAFFVLPVFAFANAGVNLDGIGLAEIESTVALGVIGGLVIGKPIGITGFTWLFTKLKIAKLPKGMHIGHVAAVSLLGGIGFTMSIFIATLGYQGKEEHFVTLLKEAKIGILLGSMIATILGLFILWIVCRKSEKISPEKEAEQNNPLSQN